MFAQDKLSSSV